ncbi:MAG TPA: plastocyanin/azurin family copper-binding protein [Actinomycetota bacterium]
MRGHTIRRAMLMVLGVMLFVSASPHVALGSGGGGCGRAVTDADGTSVRIRNFCFGPTVLRVPEGETVTWVNRDDFPHVVLGANAAWGGYGKVRGGGEVGYRFVNSGVYPYVCTYHPGMIGAVVVGNGKPDGGAYTVTTNAGPVIQAESSQDAMEPQAVPVAVTPTAWAPAAWVIGLLVVVAAAIAASRRRRAHGTVTD